MRITKGKMVYTIAEHMNGWIISYTSGKLVVEFKISKTECATFSELKNYILTSDEFGG